MEQCHECAAQVGELLVSLEWNTKPNCGTSVDMLGIGLWDLFRSCETLVLYFRQC